MRQEPRTSPLAVSTIGLAVVILALAVISDGFRQFLLTIVAVVVTMLVLAGFALFLYQGSETWDMILIGR